MTVLRSTSHVGRPHRQHSAAASRAVLDLASSVADIDPTLLPELAATAVSVDAHGSALEATLRRFNTLEGRLGHVVQHLRRSGRQVSEVQFAALLDYIGDSDVRTRIERLHAAFPP
jgi:hypothetical protein